jgi:hypothetical protein
MKNPSTPKSKKKRSKIAFSPYLGVQLIPHRKDLMRAYGREAIKHCMDDIDWESIEREEEMGIYY